MTLRPLGYGNTLSIFTGGYKRRAPLRFHIICISLFYCKNINQLTIILNTNVSNAFACSVLCAVA